MIEIFEITFLFILFSLFILAPLNIYEINSFGIKTRSKSNLYFNLIINLNVLLFFSILPIKLINYIYLIYITLLIFVFKNYFLNLRNDSKTYGYFESTLLTCENKKRLFIPKGFAHGFVVLSETAIFSYKVDNYYNPESESGIIWNDPDLNIDWKIPKDEIIISEKDNSLPRFNNINNLF